MNADTINIIIKTFFINILSILVFLKINNYKILKNIDKIKVGLTVIIISCIYYVLKKYLDSLTLSIIVYFVEVICLSNITNLKLNRVLIATIISIVIVYFILGIAVALEFLLQTIFKIQNTITNLLLVFAIEFLIILMLLKLKRLKNGLSFLQRDNEYIEITIVNISAVMILLYGLIGNELNKIKHIYFYFLVLGILTAVIIQKTLIMYYKQKLLKDTIKQYETELKEKDNIIRKLSNEKYEISRINHEFYNRQKALELKVKEFTSETSNEIGILDRIENLTKEYSQNLQNIKGKEKLPLTNIPEIDDMFSYMQSECKNNNIDFKLQIQGEIYYLVNNIIPTNKLETLIGDLLRNAIIAINSSESKYKSILTILGIKEEYYELCICDSGIEFEINTLLKLGLERATTHKETGGSGIGFMTTFKTLKESRASLIIEERHQIKEDDYTKVLKIRFDGKNEYKIISYRADSIKEKCKGEKRIIIDKI